MSTPVTARPLTKDDIEAELAAYHGRRFCCLTNRGTTALAAALHALGKPPGTSAVFPAAMCSIPVFAASFAGWKPDFADVDLRDGNFDLAHLEEVLARGAGRVGAVVPVHMFGRPDDLDALRALCLRYGAALVEDVALSMGAARGGKRAGAAGDLACLSFVRKMLPLEMGGAVLTDDAALDARARDFVGRLPVAPPDAREETAAAMRAFHALTADVAAGGWKDTERLAPFEAEFRRLLPARTGEADWAASIVLDELAALDDAVRARRARAEVYDTALNHPRLVPLANDGSCFFACAVRLDGVAAEDFLDFASAQGFSFRRVAYPDVHPVFGPRRGEFPNAARMEKEVVGFPVDDDQPVSAFWEVARDFQTLFEDYLRAAPRRPPFAWEGKLEARLG